MPAKDSEPDGVPTPAITMDVVTKHIAMLTYSIVKKIFIANGVFCFPFLPAIVLIQLLTTRQAMKMYP